MFHQPFIEFNAQGIVKTPHRMFTYDRTVKINALELYEGKSATLVYVTKHSLKRWIDLENIPETIEANGELDQRIHYPEHRSLQALYGLIVHPKNVPLIKSPWGKRTYWRLDRRPDLDPQKA